MVNSTYLAPCPEPGSEYQDRRSLEESRGVSWSYEHDQTRSNTIKGRGKRYTSIAVLTTNGVEDVYITESSVDGDVFLDFVRRCILPLLMPFNGTNPNSIVVMDNASIHHIDPVFELLTAVGALVKLQCIIGLK